MADQLQIQNDKAVLTTDEGVRIERPADDITEMFRHEMLPPLNGTAFPDGTKFVEWRDPFLLLVHQMPWQVRGLRWIANDSPSEFGEGTTYRSVRLSLPYSITFALFFCRNNRLHLTDANELYFRNGPLTSKTDRVGYPGLLNISRIPAARREKSWICTQYLKRTPDMNWTQQLTALLEHTWNGGFNLSSENHEGASWYSMYKNSKTNYGICPIEQWESETTKNEAYGVSGVNWMEAPLPVGELMESILDEQRSSIVARRRRLPTATSNDIVSRFMNFAQQRASKTTSGKASQKSKSAAKT